MAKNKRPKLLCLKGLPASGKSTYAKELESKGWGRTNKDDIRKLNFPNYEFKDEKKVIAIENGMIKAHLSAGRNVVVDNTHFNPKHQQRLEAIAKEFNADFEVLFIDTPLEECIKRNRKRTDSVPMEVILNMYNKYIAPYKEKHVEYDDTLDEAISINFWRLIEAFFPSSLTLITYQRSIAQPAPFIGEIKIGVPVLVAYIAVRLNQVFKVIIARRHQLLKPSNCFISKLLYTIWRHSLYSIDLYSSAGELVL